MAYTVVYGIGVVAIIQGIVGGIGYWIFGFKGVIVWTLLLALASVIPVIGTALIWLPTGAYLILTGNYFNGIGLLAYGLFIISYTDNITRLYFFKKVGKIHPLVTLIGILIGVPLFGLAGFILGPVIFALFMVVLDIFHKEYFV